MKNISKKLSRGFATIELLIAFAILLINITGVLLLSTSVSTKDTGSGLVIAQGQAISIKSETNQEALYIAEEQIEDKKIKSKTEFPSINSTNEESIVSGPLTYTRKFSILDLTLCKKLATTSVSWTLPNAPLQKIELSTLLTDIPGALALLGDCPFNPPGSGDWKKPIDVNYSGVSLKTEGYGKAVDAQNKFAYLVTKAAGNNKDDFYIFNTTDVDNPIKEASLDISDGLEDIDVAGSWAFIANDENQDIEQLVTLDISTPSLPGTPVKTSLPGVSGNCPNTCPGGRSIYFYDNKVYVGTHRLVASGAAEFHIFNVTNPLSPSWLGSKGGVSLGDPTDHNINEISVKNHLVSGVTNTYAYLATSNNSGELSILNVTDPANIPDPVGTSATGAVLNLPGSNASNENLDATALSVIGNRAYIGRERATGTNSDFYVVDISNPWSPSILGSMNLGLNSNGSAVTGIQVISNLAFLATSDPNMPFLVLDISNPASINRWDLLDCAVDFSTYPTGIDYDNNLIYLPLHNASSNINFKIIKSTGGSCS